MLIAIESSCISGLDGTFSWMSNAELTKRRQGGLSQTDSPVVRRSRVVRPDFQMAAQKGFHILQEQFVLKNSAGENDCVQPMRLSDRDKRKMQTLRDPPL